jgi:hypothetical protein
LARPRRAAFRLKPWRAAFKLPRYFCGKLNAKLFTGKIMDPFSIDQKKAAAAERGSDSRRGEEILRRSPLFSQ